MCSIADLSSGEVRAILKLGHDVKRNPATIAHALDAKQMVLMLRRPACARASALRPASTPSAANAIFVDHTSSPLGERESVSDVARMLSAGSNIIVLRTYAHDHYHRNGRQLARPVVKRTL